MKKIVYAISGNTGGHVSAARAVMAAMDELKIGPFQHKLIDFFAKTSRFWDFSSNSYAVMNEYFPWLYKIVYEYSNNPKRIRNLAKINFPFMGRRIAKVIKEEAPDLIVSMFGPTHQPIMRALEYLNLKIPVVTYVLDPVSVHASWVDPKVDCHIVATEEARDRSIELGMPEDKIKDIGFPIHPGFLENYGNKEDLRRGFDLDPYIFTALIMGGGAGIKKIFNVVKALNSSDLNVQLIVVAGFNKRLELKLLRTRFRFPIKVFGFTDRIPEIMAASDAMITKAGPGAVFEAIAKELPLIITGNIPGQEEGNVDYVEKNGLGIIAREPDKIVEAVRRMQTAGIEEFKSNMRRIRNPAAVYEIAKLIASYLSGNENR